MAITDYTAARLSQGIATLYAGKAAIAQLVTEENKVLVDDVNRAGTVVKDFVPLADGSVTALTRNTSETASGSQNIIPVTFSMLEYGKGTDAVVFPWKEFMIRAEAPGAYMKIVESLANKAITAADKLGAAVVRDAIGAGTNAAYVHPLGPDDQGGGVMGFTSPTASKLVRYGTQSTTRANRAAITTADVATWDWVQSMAMTLNERNCRPVANLGGSPIMALIAHGHLINDLLKSLSQTSVYSNLLANTGMAQRLGEQGIGASLVGLYDGALIIRSDRMVYAAAGSGSINVYPMVMVGGDFLAKAALSPAALPQIPSDGDLYSVGDGSCVIVQPDYSGVHSNRLGTCSWYGYLGYGVYDPYAYVRVECASTSAGRL